MLSHEQVWRGIDRLALRNEMSPSGLAKRAGLDPTTFNKSKRITKEGKLRWPSTESLSKVLDATQTSLGDFVRLVDGNGEGSEPATAAPRLRFIRLADLAEDGMTDESGFPSGSGWEELDFPLVEDANAYVVELDRDVAPPAYRSGDLIVVSPASGIRRGDRVVVRERNGLLTVGVLLRRTAHRVTISSVADGASEHVVDVRDLAWLARIVWVSQ